MRYGIRHLLRASLVLSSLFVSPFASAQDCPSCANEGAMVGPAGPLGATGCWQEEACQGCAKKSCYGYRPYTENSQPDVFFNLYQPNNFGEAAAAYPAPLPTPNWVGHTYYTYQPLMPHEFLYHHHRTYRQYYNNGMGMNRTTVHWYGTPVRTAAKSIGDFFTIPR